MKTTRSIYKGVPLPRICVHFTPPPRVMEVRGLPAAELEAAKELGGVDSEARL